MAAIVKDGIVYGNTPTATKEVEEGTFEKPITTGTYANEYLTKKDGIVYLSLRLHNTSVTGYTTIWATLPEGFCPSRNIHLMGSVTIDGVRTPVLIAISQYGQIQQSYGAIEVTELNIAGSFIAAE